MATILPEGLYNANTYTITWDENEPAFYLISGDGWLKNVQYFGLGTDTPGTNEGKVIIDNWCIREKLKDYQHQYRISGKTYATDEYETEYIFKKDIARYQVPSYHIDGKKMYGTGEANYNGYLNRYNFETIPEGKLYLTENETVPVLNAKNVLKFGWGNVSTNDLEEVFVLGDDVDSIVQAFLAPINGFFSTVLDVVGPYVDPDTISLFGKLSLQRQYCVVKFYERDNPSVFGYTAVGANNSSDYKTLTLNNSEQIPVICWRSSNTYPSDSVSLVIGVEAVELSPTEDARGFVHPDETIRFTLNNNSIGAVAVKLIYAGGLDNGVVINDGGSYDGSIKVSTDRYLKVIITAHCSSTENAWIEIYAKPAAEQGGDTRGGWVEMTQMIPIIHPNYKKYDFVALPYLNPYDKCNNCKAVLDGVGVYTTCPHCGSTNIVKFR